MKALLYSAKRTKLFSLILLLGFFGYTQEEPLNFDYNTYLSQKNDTCALDLVSVSSFKVERNISLETITQIS
jgi:hypothetical protein